MEIKTAQMLSHFETGIFAALDEKKEELMKQGRRVYNFSVGTPDFEPAPHIIQAFTEAASNPENYKYSLRDLPELLEAVKDYYMERFGVSVELDEIMSVHGSQEGIGHLGMALTSPGDIAILPNPGYPIFEAGAYLGGAEMFFYPLKEENDYRIDFASIPEEVAQRAKFMVLSYPYNPVCSIAPEGIYDEAIAFAKKYNIILIHDNAYSDIVYDGNYGDSFLAYEGAKEVGVEFFSLSKSFNVTGLRISFVVGNKQVIAALKKLRSQIDFGMPYPVQYAAIAALRGPKDQVKEQCKKYEERRNALCGGFRRIGWNMQDSRGTMFAWGRIPEKFKSSEEFCLTLMEKTGVICTPGHAFGTLGEGYVRFALVHPVEVIEEVIQQIEKSGILD